MTTPITKEQAEAVFDLRAGYQLGNTDIDILCKLAEYALAARDAEPVGEVSEQPDGLVMDGTVHLGGSRTHRVVKGLSKMKRLPLGTKFYTAPPAPVDNTFIPKNLDRALGVVGVALPESKEEFNFQIERWIQRLIDRVIRYADEFKEQPEPVLPKANPCLKAMMQALDAFYAEEEVPERGMLSAFRILLDDTCRAAMLQGKAEPVSQPYKLPSQSSDAVNEAAWKLHDTLTEHGPLNGHQFNNLKGCFYEALKVAMCNSPVIPDGWQLVPKRLTAENGAKGALSGEFSETKFINCPECFGDEDCETCDGSGRIEISVPVTWTTIKAIWAKGVEHFSEAPQQEGK